MNCMKIDVFLFILVPGIIGRLHSRVYAALIALRDTKHPALETICTFSNPAFCIIETIVSGFQNGVFGIRLAMYSSSLVVVCANTTVDKNTRPPRLHTRKSCANPNSALLQQCAPAEECTRSKLSLTKGKSHTSQQYTSTSRQNVFPSSLHHI